MVNKKILIEMNFMNLVFRMRLKDDKHFKFLNNYLNFQTERNYKVLKYIVPLDDIDSFDPSIYLLVKVDGILQYLIVRFLHEDMVKKDICNLDFVQKYHLESIFDKTLPYGFLQFLYNDEELFKWANTLEVKIDIYDEEKQKEIMYLYHKGMQIGAIAMFLNIKESIIRKTIEYNLKKENEKGD